MQCHVDKYVIVSNGNEYTDTYTAYHVVQFDEGGIEDWDMLGEPYDSYHGCSCSYRRIQVDIGRPGLIRISSGDKETTCLKF